MFSRLFDFGFKRTPVQAFGFYLAFLFLIMLTGALGGSVAGVFAPSAEDAYEFGVKIGSILAVIICVILCALMLKAKNLHTHFGWVLIVFVSGFLALLGGGIGGLLPIAFLSTKKKRK